MIGDEFFMKMAFQEAQLASEEGEIPVGAVITCHNRVISKAHNQTEQLNDVTAHAEMLAFTSAAEALGAKYLTDCTLYVTLEPCVMCAGAAFWTQISKIVYAAPDPKRGFSRQGNLLHPKTIIEQGPFASESAALLKKFFAAKR
ncbi:MAG TPA: nucleoside deaminase [Salinivirga sp.]|uniref:nucleoside deaminase n=1 Tax=Salinivirga sp. TaxID=1970192 RepID=UPI002B49110E|nr:nucleoside deaminase [Salinivirga sp.]HKK57867.1 nucleoside deaminase [Salinivirga sp.]